MATTTNEDIQHALNKCFSSFTPTIVKVYENTEYDPSIVTPHLRSWLLPVETMPITLGPTCVHEYAGIFQVTCFYPKGFGFNTAKTMAGKVISHFYRGRQITYNNILVRVLRSWVEPGFEVTEYYSVPCSIRYWCFDNSV
jgi:hypothetical protein